MHDDRENMQWERVSEDVVSVNIPCIRITIRGDNGILIYVYRLWAEVHGDGDYMQWKRVSEDVVSVCLSVSVGRLYVYRLWADVFRVHGDGDYMRWERVPCRRTWFPLTSRVSD